MVRRRIGASGLMYSALGASGIRPMCDPDAPDVSAVDNQAASRRSICDRNGQVLEVVHNVPVELSPFCLCRALPNLLLRARDHGLPGRHGSRPAPPGPIVLWKELRLEDPRVCARCLRKG